MTSVAASVYCWPSYVGTLNERRELVALVKPREWLLFP